MNVAEYAASAQKAHLFFGEEFTEKMEKLQTWFAAPPSGNHMERAHMPYSVAQGLEAVCERESAARRLFEWCDGIGNLDVPRARQVQAMIQREEKIHDPYGKARVWDRVRSAYLLRYSDPTPEQFAALVKAYIEALPRHNAGDVLGSAEDIIKKIVAGE